MRVLFAPHGTRGDIQPLVALARALSVRGHQIRFVAPVNAVPWIRAHGFACEPSGVDIEAEVRAMESRTRAMRRHLQRIGDEIVPRLFESVARTAADADVLVSSGVPFAAPSVAEARGIPHVYALFCPAALPNAEGPPPIVQRQTLPRWVNRALWGAMPMLGDIVLGSAINKGRTALGLRPERSPVTGLMRARMLVAADPELAPLPADLPGDGTPTEPWILPDACDLDPRITAFLSAGPAPIYVGFGSMVARRSLNLGRRVVDAAGRAGHRLILAGGWASLDEGLQASDGVLALSEAPHARLFPLVAAAVHHGGAGTTTAAARAGVPQAIIPHVLDQFYWGHRVEVLGLGPPALPIDDVSTDALASRIAAVTSPSFAERAKEFGERAVHRDGVPVAVDYLERLVGGEEKGKGEGRSEK